MSAPVTPPLSSPTCQTPRIPDIDDQTKTSIWPGSHFHIPGIQTPPDSGWLSGVQTPQEGPSSPTFSLVASGHQFGFKDALSSRMWTPGQSGTCSPAVNGGIDQTSDVPMSDVISSEFAFGSNMKGLVKPWEGEKIHEECVSDDLELTLGNPSTR